MSKKPANDNGGSYHPTRKPMAVITYDSHPAQHVKKVMVDRFVVDQVVLATDTFVVKHGDPCDELESIPKFIIEGSVVVLTNDGAEMTPSELIRLHGSTLNQE